MKHILRKSIQIRAAALSFSIIIMLIGMFSSVVRVVSAVGWSSDYALTTHLAYDNSPSVMQTQNGTIWVVWASDRRYVQYDIFLKASADNGLSWTDPVPLTQKLSVDQNPTVMQTQNGSIYMVWCSERTGNKELFYMTTPDHGENWGDVIQLTNSSYKDINPSIAQNVDGTISVVWQRLIGGNYDLFFKNSTDHGLTWSNATQLTTDPSADVTPSICYTWNGTLWLVWASHRTGIYDIYCKTSADNGLSWTDPVPLVASGKYDVTPSIATHARNGSIWMVWAREAGGQYDLYYKYTVDHGLNWTPDTALPLDDSGDDASPSVIITEEGKVWVVWESVRTDNYDVFYKISDPIVIHDVAITSVTPSSTTVYKGQEVSIQVVAENQGTRNETFDVNCYVNSTSIGYQTIDLTNGTATTLFFSWDTVDFQCGTYNINATASIVPDETVPSMDDNSFVDGEVEVKIPDLNGDGIVDMLEVHIMVMAYGTMPGMPNWNPVADVAEPFGLIDGRDTEVIVDNFGQTY